MGNKEVISVYENSIAVNIVGISSEDCRVVEDLDDVVLIKNVIHEEKKVTDIEDDEVVDDYYF